MNLADTLKLTDALTNATHTGREALRKIVSGQIESLDDEALERAEHAAKLALGACEDFDIAEELREILANIEKAKLCL